MERLVALREFLRPDASINGRFSGLVSGSVITAFSFGEYRMWPGYSLLALYLYVGIVFSAEDYNNNREWNLLV